MTTKTEPRVEPEVPIRKEDEILFPDKLCPDQKEKLTEI